MKEDSLPMKEFSSF